MPTPDQVTFLTGSESNLSSVPIVNGQIIFTDEGNIYHDKNGTRIKMTEETTFTMNNG